MIIAVEDKSYRCKNCDSFSQCEYYNHRRPDSHICKEFRNDWRQRDVLDKISAEIEERIAVYDNWQTQRECTAAEANTMREALAIVKKYMAESEETE